MIDSQLLGETAARCMESLDEAEHLEGGKILAVGIVVIAENAESDQTYTRVFCSDTIYYRQLGIFQAGHECVRDGFRIGHPDDPSGEDDEEE